MFQEKEHNYEQLFIVVGFSICYDWRKIGHTFVLAILGREGI